MYARTMNILQAIAALRPSERRIKAVVDVALLILSVVSRTSAGASELANDPDRALELAIAQAIKHTGLNLNAKEITRAVGRIVLQQQLDQLKVAADDLLVKLAELKRKHPNI